MLILRLICTLVLFPVWKKRSSTRVWDEARRNVSASFKSSGVVNALRWWKIICPGWRLGAGLFYVRGGWGKLSKAAAVWSSPPPTHRCSSINLPAAASAIRPTDRHSLQREPKAGLFGRFGFFRFYRLWLLKLYQGSFILKLNFLSSAWLNEWPAGVKSFTNEVRLSAFFLVFWANELPIVSKRFLPKNQGSSSYLL